MTVVLVLYRVELVFFTVTSMRLGIGFLLHSSVDNCECFCFLHRVKAFSASHTTPPESRLRMYKLRGDTAGTVGPN